MEYKNDGGGESDEGSVSAFVTSSSEAPCGRRTNTLPDNLMTGKEAIRPSD